MMGLVAVVCVVGIPAVGLMLVVAFLIVPCAAARLWSTRLIDVLVISGLIGGISGWFGGAFFQLAQFADRTRHCFGGRGHFCFQPLLCSSAWSRFKSVEYVLPEPTYR